MTEMKKCPFCAEKILDEAVKCKHCGEWLQRDPTSAVDIPAPVATTEYRELPLPQNQVAPATQISLLKILAAWAVVTWVLVSQQAQTLLSPDFTFSIKLAAILLVALNAAAAIALVRVVRSTSATGSVTVWGLIWRSVVATFASAIVKLLVQKVLSIDLKRVEFSLVNTLAWEAFSLLAISLSVWLLFSTDRRGQLRLIFSAVRGY